MKVTFYGAVRTVTGSMHLVETGGVRVLLDCGLFQGRRADANQFNSHLPFDAAAIDAVVLSHAHLDHCGNLPTLVRQGFRGSVYCTPATRDIAALVLRDSAKVQAQDADYLNRHQVGPPIAPLYAMDDAEAAISRFVSFPYGRPFSIGNATVTFSDAGHILGSALTFVAADDRTLGFTGDLGRPNAPILRDPDLLPAVDVLLTESTYGDRRHADLDAGERQVGQLVRDTITRGGTVLIPAFAVERAQDLVWLLHRQRESGQIPPAPAFVDSPMAVDVTEIFRLHADCFDAQIRAHLEEHDPFGFKQLRYVRSAAESKALNSLREPFIVVATSGMCEAGRILHHLAHRLGDPRSTLLIVSFQAAHTLGRRLADGVSPVRIFGDQFAVRLQVHALHAFSSHADRGELLDWIGRIPKVGRAFCVHGELTQAEALATALSAKGIPSAVPARGESIIV
ncbi:MAG TPA: MBL fold metallo-hydrolase [bacterium]|nr:MBL fold metallo-hydrolase [bacterium]